MMNIVNFLNGAKNVMQGFVQKIIMLIQIKNWKREKILNKNKEKIIDSEKNKRTTQKSEIDEINNNFQETTNALEMMKSYIAVS